MDPRECTLATAGALAAGLLVKGCRMDRADSPSLKVVGNLALDLERRLDALTRTDAEDDLVEASLACADLATLAACNLSGLPPEGEPLAMAAVHLAAGTTRALVALVESRTGDPDDAHAENVLRDARGALWRADLAARQIDALQSPGAPG